MSLLKLQTIVEDTDTNKAFMCDYILGNSLDEIAPNIIPAIQACCARNKVHSKVVNLEFKLFNRTMRELAHSNRTVNLLEMEVQLNDATQGNKLLGNSQ